MAPAGEEEDGAGRDWVLRIDLQYMLKRLVRNASLGFTTDGKLQHRAILVLTYMCAGRGGESKFVNTMQWKHHTRFLCTDIVWVEIKTLKKHAMPMFSNKLCWLSDFYHAIGAFWMV